MSPRVVELVLQFERKSAAGRDGCYLQHGRVKIYISGNPVHQLAGTHLDCGAENLAYRNRWSGRLQNQYRARFRGSWRGLRLYR
jgi:hypothetical protein